MSNWTPPSGQPPKQLSSRLMTMKFMQRAAASSPASSSPSTPDSSSAPATKRQKTNDASPMPRRPAPSAGTNTPKYPSAPTYLKPESAEDASGELSSGTRASGGHSASEGQEERPSTPIDWRREARDAALAEEARRQAALESLGPGSSGETRWVLQTDGLKAGVEVNGGIDGGLKVVRFGEVNRESTEENGTVESSEPWRDGDGGGRMRFGRWKVEQSSANDMAQKQSDSDEGNNSSRSSSPGDTPSRPANPLTDGPPSAGKKGGISSGGRIKNPGGGASDNRKCFRCGQTGHVRNQCPLKQESIIDAVRKAKS